MKLSDHLDLGKLDFLMLHFQQFFHRDAFRGRQKDAEIWNDLLGFYASVSRRYEDSQERHDKFPEVKKLHEYFNRSFHIQLIESKYELIDLAKGGIRKVF